MKKLSPFAIVQSNKVDSDSVWLLLLEIILPNDPDPIRVVHNNEDVDWNGQLWQAFPFTLSEGKSDDKGSLPSLYIDVDNTTRDLEYYLKQGNGGAGAKVVLRCVLSTALDNLEPEFEEYYAVKNTTVTAQTVRFNLGNAYPQKARRPWRRAMKNTCPFKYKGIVCAATSNFTSCNHTLADCKARKNSARFGGFTGIPQGGLYV